MYTHDSILNRGEYTHTPIRYVPAAYLLELCNSEPEDSELSVFLNRHVCEWLTRYEREKTKPLRCFIPKGNGEVRRMGKSMMLSCPTSGKYIFPSRQSAKQELKRIRLTGNNGQKIPVRTYECPHCSGWHLTSEDHRKWNSYGKTG